MLIENTFGNVTFKAPSPDQLLSEALRAAENREQDVSPEEAALIAAVKKANPFYWDALKEALAIMPGRRANYSPNDDPFENFRVAADILKHYSKFKNAGIVIEPRDVVFIYAILKVARVLTGGGTNYEAEKDGIRDLANYIVLMRGKDIQDEK